MADLSVEIAGLALANPVMPAAGPPGWNGKAMKACAEGGAGAIVAKTVSVEPAVVPTPNMAQVPSGFLNTELWSETPVEQFIEQEFAIAQEAGVPLIVSLGYTAEQIAQLTPRVRPFADALHRASTEGYGLIAEIKKASPSKGLIRADFDPVAFVAALGDRIHFVHLRNTARDDGQDGLRVSFEESAHLDGDTDMVALVEVQRERCKTLVEMADISTFFYRDFGYARGLVPLGKIAAGADKLSEMDGGSPVYVELVD